MPVDETLLDHFERKSKAEAVRVPEQPTRSPLDWTALESQQPPIRQWAIDGWLGRGYVTLLSGPPGAGKTAIAQSIGAAVSLGRHVIDAVPEPTNALLWAGEDDSDELWRRQVAIANWLGEPLSAFKDKFIVEPCADRDISLCTVSGGALTKTPMLKELRDQIGDYRVGLVFLDSVARLYGGSENDRHQVTQFIAWLTWALQPTGASIVLLGHPAKAVGSEFSGSTAWEASVRARLYFGYKLPDQPDNDELEADTDQRWLAKRKTNYSTKDTREVRWADGCMQPRSAPEGFTQSNRSLEFLATQALQVFRDLKRMGFDAGASPGHNYLPRLAKAQNLLTPTLTERDLKNGLAELLKAGRLVQGVVGTYSNRAPKKGLLEGENDPF